MDGHKMRKGPRVRYPDGDGIESMPMKRAGIYQVLNTATGAGYVGSAMDVRFRCQMHRGSIHRGSHDNRLIRRDAREHGPGVFRFKLLEIVEDIQLLRFKESEWIRWMQADGPGASYNLMIGQSMLLESRYLIAERVLLENRSFCLLPGVSRNDPVSDEFLKTWSPNYLLDRRGN